MRPISNFRFKHGWQRWMLVPFAIALLGNSILPSLVQAQVPQKAVLKKIRGPKELWIRRRGRPTPAQPGSVLEKYNDSLLVNGNAKTYASLQFFSSSNQALSLFVRTEIHPESALYYFPCQMKGGAHLFGWGLASKLSQGCSRGVTIRSKDLVSQTPTFSLPVASGTQPTLVAQGFPKQNYYCTVNHSSGQSWLAMTAGDPCAQILSECSDQGGGSCTIETLGQWWSNEPDLTAAIECQQNRVFKTSASGDDLTAAIQRNWDEAIAKGAKGCAVQLYSPHELVVVPPSPEQLKAAGHNPHLPDSLQPGVLIRTQTSTNLCPEVKVMDGAALVKSAENPTGVLVAWGNKTTVDYCQAAQVEPIQDIKAESRDLSIEVFDAELREMPFCDEVQVSGGQTGDRRTLQLTANQGVLDIEHDMKPIPDQMQILYEGKELYNSGMVSGTKKVKLEFQGSSGRLEIIVTGNPENSGTEWDYKISCPT